MNRLFIALILGCLFSCTLAHICLVNPHQRGSMSGYNQPAADDCDLTTPGPCGGRREGSPSAILKGGEDYVLVFQKNFDHWYKSAPGNFTVSWSESPDGKFKPLVSLPDTSAPSLTYYTASIQLPKKDVKHGVFQVVYYPNNPQAPAAFYQCADVSIHA